MFFGIYSSDFLSPIPRSVSVR